MVEPSCIEQQQVKVFLQIKLLKKNNGKIMIQKKITKTVIPISIDKKLAELIANTISNKSKYIEWLIYQDMKDSKVEGIKDIFI